MIFLRISSCVVGNVIFGNHQRVMRMLMLLFLAGRDNVGNDGDDHCDGIGMMCET